MGSLPPDSYKIPHFVERFIFPSAGNMSNQARSPDTSKNSHRGPWLALVLKSLRAYKCLRTRAQSPLPQLGHSVETTPSRGSNEKPSFVGEGDR